MKKDEKSLSNFAICKLLLPMSAVLLSISTVYAQAPMPTPSAPLVTKSTTYRSLPAGVFRGSLPAGKPNLALLEAGQNAQDAISQGEALFKSGKLKEAIASYNEALPYSPYDGLAYRRLARSLYG